MAIISKTVHESETSVPEDGYVLTWDGDDGYWAARAPSGGGGFTAGGDLTGTSTDQTVVSLTGTGGIVNSAGDIFIDKGGTMPSFGSLRLANNQYISTIDNAGSTNIGLIAMTGADTVDVGNNSGFSYDVRINNGGYIGLQLHKDVNNLSIGSASLSDFCSGEQNVIFIRNTVIEPESIPTPDGGGLLYSVDGYSVWKSSSGIQQTISGSYLNKDIEDTDYDMDSVESERRSKIIEINGALTGNREIYMPSAAGYQWIVFNNTSGGFSITFMVFGQTGVVVANGKHATIYSNGIDIIRATADI